MLPILDRALAARRESRRVALKESFDPAAERDWVELIRDIVALANSGGGVIVFGVDKAGNPTGHDIPAVDPVAIAERLKQYADSFFADLELLPASKDSQPLAALLVGEAVTPIVFTRPGLYTTADGKQKSAFNQGAVYFRHGGKSRPGTTEDLANAIDRRIREVRRSWFSAVRRVVQSPVGAAPAVLPPEVRDSDSPRATPIRVVDDPRVPAFRLVDYDRTHPYRQKELLAELQARRTDIPVNQFDMLSVRHVHDVDAKPEFSHQGVYGTRQYSPKYLEWLLEQLDANPRFFEEARQRYRSSQHQVVSSQ